MKILEEDSPCSIKQNNRGGGQKTTKTNNNDRKQWGERMEKGGRERGNEENKGREDKKKPEQWAVSIFNLLSFFLFIMCLMFFSFPDSLFHSSLSFLLFPPPSFQCASECERKRGTASEIDPFFFQRHWGLVGLVLGVQMCAGNENEIQARE